MAETTSVSQPVQETERQQAELEALRRMLAASSGTFSLSVAVCNSPALRDYLIERIRNSGLSIAVVSLSKATGDVFETVKREVSSAPSALFLVNLEALLPSDARDHPILKGLNATRELWQSAYPCPVVFWVPEYVATLLSTHARDLWAWRSHQFEFVSELAGATAGLQDRISGDLLAAGSLDADQKRFRIAELEQRIREAGDPPQQQLATHVSIWLTELGYLFHMLGDIEQAEAMLRKALETDTKLGRLEDMATDYGHLGLICRARGDLEQAEAMLRKALEINTKLGRLEGMATDYSNLGLIYQTRGDLEQAETMHREALEIHKKLGHLAGTASNYGNLGLICEARGDLEQAEAMLRKALGIDAKLGHLQGMATGYVNLGSIYFTRGDLEQAEAMQRKALEIHTKLGHLEGMANDYANLGSVREQRKDFQGARKLWTDARDIYQKIGMPHMVQKLQSWLDQLPDE